MTLFKRAGAFVHNPPAWLAGALAAAGLGVFMLQAAWYAHTTISSLDEGAYLFKGILFASGQYRPFEPYGVLTNKAPLAFLIPGYVQLIFGPGLRTGRYLAVLFGVLSVVCTWAAARRLGGKWPAAAAVWVVALSPVTIKIFSEGVTQSTVAFLLALVLALSLGEGRPAWQLALAGLLAGVMILVRQNMVLVLPLLVLYVLWERGWKPALYTALAGAGVLAIFHALYWPYIMQLWLTWLPDSIATLFPDVIGRIGDSAWDPDIDLAGRLLSFFQGVRFHFAAVAGTIVGLLLWPARRAWRSAAEFRAAVFLIVLFIGLLLMHSWASISNDYCVYCFTPYLAFFNTSAILFLVLAWRVLERQAHPLRQVALALAVLTICAGIGYSAVEDIGGGLLALDVPRLREGRILPGSTTLWELLSNKYALQRNMAERLVSAAGGAALGAGLLVLAWRLHGQFKRAGVNYGYVLGVSTLALGIIFSPLLAGRARQADCGEDVIAANEQVGAHLAGHIPPGSQVYWNGGLSVAPLLYTPGIGIYPAQINNGYTFLEGADEHDLLKYGYWSRELAEKWFGEADFIVVEGWRYADMKDSLPPSEFDELPRSPSLSSCKDGSGLRIFRRK